MIGDVEWVGLQLPGSHGLFCTAAAVTDFSAIWSASTLDTQRRRLQDRSNVSGHVPPDLSTV